MRVEDIVAFSEEHIDRILFDPEIRKSEAARLSVKTAIATLEKGFLGSLTARSRAKKVLALAVNHRQNEAGPTVRWRIASLVESLATLRLISLDAGSSFSPRHYEEWKERVVQALRIRRGALAASGVPNEAQSPRPQGPLSLTLTK